MNYSNNAVIDVLLTTEGTYPTVRGGVSTWCDVLVRGVESIRYQVYTILAHPFLPDLYQLPHGVRVCKVPMWGTEEPAEHLGIPFSVVYERKLRTTEAAIRQEFLPLLDELIWAILDPGAADGLKAGRVLYRLYLFFQRFDYLEAFKSELVWNFYLNGLLSARWSRFPSPPTLLECLQTIGWLYRFMIVLNTPVPRADVTHSSAAAFCGLPGVLAKLDRKTPFLLTEHGVYLREQYLSVGRSSLTPFSKTFLINLIRLVTEVNYAYADLLAPVAEFNCRWEQRLGVPEERIRVIYNGVDPSAFSPRPRPAGLPLTVVSVARIDPLKDILTFLRAAALVRRQVPEAKFAVFGSVSDPGYYRRCLQLRDELELGENFVFPGHVTDVPAVYAGADVVVLSSITEGFPYAVVEAMMSGRAVVATDVGGTREACAGAGILVPPRNPEELASAIVKLLQHPDLRLSMAAEARERALAEFTIQRNLRLYRKAYEDLALPASVSQNWMDLVSKRRQLCFDRAQALVSSGLLREAISEYRLAADLDPAGPSSPAILLQIAGLFLELGEPDQAWREMEKAEVLAIATDNSRVA